MLSSLQEATGNSTTCKRIATFLQEEHSVDIKDAKTCSKVKESDYDAAFGLHAYHAGKTLQHFKKTPFVIVLGTFYSTVHSSKL